MENVETEFLVRSSHIKETQNADGAVLLDPVRGKCYPLTPVEALIWTQAGQGLTVAQIAQTVATTCNVSLDLVVPDVHKYVRELLEAELLSRPNAANRANSRWAGLRRLLGRLWQGTGNAAQIR